MRRLVCVTLMALLIVSFAGIGMAAKGTIKIGAKNFTEQYVVGELMKILLEENGYKVDYKSGMGTAIVRKALEEGAIDLYMEYTGTGWMTHLGHLFEGESADELYQKVKEEDAGKGLVWLDAIKCNNTYALAVRREFSEQHNLKTLSDLASYVKEKKGKVPIASGFEFYARPDGLIGLMKLYEFAFHPDYIKVMAVGLTFGFLQQKEVDVTMVFGTDPVVQKYNWVVLQDDKSFFPPYDLCPVIRKETAENFPEVVELLNKLISVFPTDRVEARAAMTALNYKVDISKMDAADAAREFLVEQGLIKK
ncbi:MAG: glycine betaine ABC transporter substrate-binding protein [bacterium]